MFLQAVYVILMIYGWYYWLHGDKNQKEIPVSKLGIKALSIWPSIAIIGTLIWGYLMGTFTDAAVPYGDAFTTVTSLIAQWLMTRKKLEAWIFWVAVNIVASGIYWYKDLHLTSGLYAVFLVLAIIGWFSWKKLLRKQNELQP
jgi:nicotinamide mononucleotide transporter